MTETETNPAAGLGADKSTPDLRDRVVSLVARFSNFDETLIDDETDLYNHLGLGRGLLIAGTEEAEWFLSLFVDALGMKGNGRFLVDRHFPRVPTKENWKLQLYFVPFTVFFCAVFPVLLLFQGFIYPWAGRFWIRRWFYPKAKRLLEPAPADQLPHDYIPITVKDLIRIAERGYWTCDYETPEDRIDWPRIGCDLPVGEVGTRNGVPLRDVVYDYILRSFDISLDQIHDDLDFHQDLGVGRTLINPKEEIYCFLDEITDEFDFEQYQDLRIKRHFPV